MLQEPTDLIAIIDNQDLFTHCFLLRNDLDKLGYFFFLAIIQFHQVGFRFYEFYTTIQQVLFTQRY